MNHLTLTYQDAINGMSQAFIHSQSVCDNHHSHLDYPVANVDIASVCIVFHSHMFNLVTSKYIDMEQVLNNLYLQYLGIV